MPRALLLSGMWLYAASLCAAGPADPAAPRKTPEFANVAVRCALARSVLTLDPTPPARFLLRYRGPLSAFRGPMCYRFAGYNQSCSRAPEQWLTPTTTLSFYAPGQVPVDLLRGFTLELRAPQMFAGPLRYYVTSDADAPKTVALPAAWKCPQP